jgi:hypothetical protein
MLMAANLLFLLAFAQLTLFHILSTLFHKFTQLLVLLSQRSMS